MFQRLLPSVSKPLELLLNSKDIRRSNLPSIPPGIFRIILPLRTLIINTAYIIITPMLLLAYATEGRKAIQAMKLDAIFCFVGAIVLIAGGGMSCFAWNNHLDTEYNVNRSNYEVGGALGVLTTLTGVLYLVDFFYVCYQNAMLSPNDY